MIEAMKQALEALKLIDEAMPFPVAKYAMSALRTAIAEAEKQEPAAWTEREKELIDGMIEVQLDHARRCDNIANRTMAEKQKNWDMERVTLLQKIKATPPAAQRQWVGLTDEEIDTWNIVGHESLREFVRAIEAKLKEKNT
jgi:hypothetical protein